MARRPTGRTSSRRVGKRAALGAGIVAVALGAGSATNAPAHPAHAVEPVTVEGDTLSYSPPSVEITIQQPVEWTWEGLARNHSVTSDPDQAERFNSDPGADPTNADHPVGDTFRHYFTKPGTYGYHCKVHPEMRGEIVVRPAPGSAPEIKRLRIRNGVACDGGSCREAVARYRLSKRANVVGRIAERRKGRWKTTKSFYRVGRKGRNRARLPTDSLPAARYRLELIAYDVYARDGKARDRFRLR